MQSILKFQPLTGSANLQQAFSAEALTPATEAYTVGPILVRHKRAIRDLSPPGDWTTKGNP